MSYMVKAKISGYDREEVEARAEHAKECGWREEGRGVEETHGYKKYWVMMEATVRRGDDNDDDELVGYE